MENTEQKDEFTPSREEIDNCCQLDDLAGVTKALSSPNKLVAMYGASQIMEYGFVDAIPNLISYAEQFDWTTEYSTAQIHLFGKIVDFVNKENDTSFEFSSNDNVVTLTKVITEIRSWLKQKGKGLDK